MVKRFLVKFVSGFYNIARFTSVVFRGLIAVATILFLLQNSTKAVNTFTVVFIVFAGVCFMLVPFLSILKNDLLED